jgi:hypothetical protein
MTLAEHFADPQPLEGRVLVFSETLRNLLLQIQNENPSTFRVSPFLLTDGSYILSADVLSEIGERGLFHDNFNRLPAELFSQVQIVQLADIAHLCPTEAEEEV